MSESPRRYVDVDRLSNWLEKANIGQREMAVDFADIFTAADEVREYLEEMIALDPAESSSADAMIRLLGRMRARLFVEIPHHLEHLQQGWNELEERLT